MREAAIDTHRSAARGAGRYQPAGAPSLDDMVGDGPMSRDASRRGGVTSAAVAAQRLGGGRKGAAPGRAAPGITARLRARMPRIRPIKVLTIGAFGVALVGIVANAMVFQRGHHPSPLFGLGHSMDGAPDQPAQPAVAASAVPVPGVPGNLPGAAAAPAGPTPADKTGTIAPTPAAADPKPTAAPRHAARVHRDGNLKAVPLPPDAHPRPGRPAPAHSKSENKSDAKTDPLTKLIAGSAHPAKADNKPAAAAHAAAHADSAPVKPDAKPEPAPGRKPTGSVDASPTRAHRNLAAAEAKPVGKATTPPASQ